ncbi:MAG: N-acetyltransferase [Anaerolineales bacterium]|nr:MAG: N-acetyltransferase [Anaerolineales bacterium]
MPNIALRLATKEDAAAILEIYAPIVNNTASSFEIEVPALGEMQTRIQSISNSYPWLVAEHESRILGYAYASQYRQRAGYNWAVETSVYVHPDALRQGLAALMYTALFAILKVQGFFKAYAVITLPNPSSVGLHESFGFRHFATFQSVGYKLNTWWDVGWWERVLLPERHAPAQPLWLSALVGSPQIDAILQGQAP